MGIVVGGVIKKNNYHAPSLDKVNPQTREIFKKNIRKNHGEMRKTFDEMRELKGALKDIITAEEFDKTAYDEKMQQISTIRNTIQTQKTESLGEVLSSLTWEQRQEMADHVLRKISGKRHGKGQGNYQGKRKEHKALKDKANIER